MFWWTRASKLRLPESTAAATRSFFDDGLLDRRGQRAGVADAGGAAVADQVEAELVQVGLQAGLVQIIGHDARAGRERGLDQRIGLQPRSTAFFASNPPRA